MSVRARYVFDTDTLISAALSKGLKPSQALREASQRGDILLSSDTLRELAEVFRRSKFDKYLTSAERDEFFQTLVDNSTFIKPEEEIRAYRDPKDNKFLELAVSGEAQCIVTGDADLLVLHPFRGVDIKTSADFLETLKNKEPRKGTLKILHQSIYFCGG